MDPSRKRSAPQRRTPTLPVREAAGTPGSISRAAPKRKGVAKAKHTHGPSFVRGVAGGISRLPNGSSGVTRTVMQCMQCVTAYSDGFLSQSQRQRKFIFRSTPPLIPTAAEKLGPLRDVCSASQHGRVDFFHSVGDSIYLFCPTPSTLSTTSVYTQHSVHSY